MLKEVSIHNYNGGILVINQPKPLMKDSNGTVLSYLVDARKDYNKDNKFYRESIRFKISKNNMEVYYGDFWEKKDILTVIGDNEFTPSYVKEVVSNWWKDKEFAEDPNNV